jgi:predicted MFS family arabinose efflux permease
MTSVLTIVASIVFATSLFARNVDPVIPLIADAFAVEPARAALLSTAFALPFALIQPILGPLADMIGKTRLMMVCLSIVVASAVASAFAPNFELLFAARIVTGAAAGGIFPVSLAIAGDNIPVAQRQVVIGRLLTAAMIGNLLGASLAGVLGDISGWRGVFVGSAAISIAVLVAGILGLRNAKFNPGQRSDLASLIPNYRNIFRNPLAKYCFGAVLVEGTCVHGLFPHMANLLVAGGETRASIAGIIIAGFGLGAAVYGTSVSWFLAKLGERGTMATGAGLVAFALLLVTLRMPWPVETAIFLVMGMGFYMLHGGIQVYVTELWPPARGSAVSLHSGSYFLGQAFGPIAFGYGVYLLGPTMTLILAAMGIALVGLVCATKLRRPTAKPDPV